MDDRGFTACPFCDEGIKIGATKCRHCKTDITEADFCPTKQQSTHNPLNKIKACDEGEKLDDQPNAGVEELIEIAATNVSNTDGRDVVDEETDMGLYPDDLLKTEPQLNDGTQSLKMMMNSILSDSDESALLYEAEAISAEKEITVNYNEVNFVLEKIKYLNFTAWTYLSLSIIGAIYLWEPLTWAWDEVGVAFIFALLLQAVIISGAILVFCDMASNINAIKSKVVGDSSEVAAVSDVEVVKKEEF